MSETNLGIILTRLSCEKIVRDQFRS